MVVIQFKKNKKTLNELVQFFERSLKSTWRSFYFMGKILWLTLPKDFNKIYFFFQRKVSNKNKNKIKKSFILLSKIFVFPLFLLFTFF
jgi:hypothetical protein